MRPFANLFSSILMPIFIAAMLLPAEPGHAAELEDLAGDWAILVMMPDNPQMASLSVEGADDGALTATLTSPLGTSEIDDIEVIDGQHVMFYLMDMGGQQMDIEVTANVEGDTLTGNVVVGGGAMDIPIEGARAGSDAEATLQTRLEELAAASASTAASTEPTDTATAPAEQAAAPEAEVAAEEEPDPNAGRLPVAEAEDLMGDRVLRVVTPRGVNYADFSASDEDGFVLAKFTLPPPMTIDPIRQIQKTDGAYTMKFVLNFGSSVIDMTMDLKQEGDRFLGKLVDANGMFTSEVMLLTAEQAQEQKALETADADGDGGDSDDAEANRDTTQLTFGEKEVAIQFSQTRAKGETYNAVASLEPGQVVRYPLDFATKLQTDAALNFGGTVIETENVAKNYPGVYSLWLKKTDEGWSLVFNHEPDVFGTQHNPEADAASVPLMHTVQDAHTDKMAYALKETGENAARLFIEWGEHAWVADFTVD